MLDQELTKSNSDPHEAAKRVKEQISALKYEFNEGELNKASAIAGCPKPAHAAAITMQTLKLNVLRELDQISTTRPAPPVNFKLWVQEKRERYKAWLARL